MAYNIRQIAEMMGAELIGSDEHQVSFLLTDSRSLCFPEETLFFALRTQRNDGHQYIKDLFDRGVRCFVVETLQGPTSQSIPPSVSPQEGEGGNCSFLLVPDTRKALQALARHHRERFQVPVVGITGSNGKTVVKEWLNQLLGDRIITRSPRSYNSQIGVPLSVWMMNEQTETALIEAGISEVGEMQALADIIQPTIGVFTSLGPAHQENFESMEEKCREKLLLLKDAPVVVYLPMTKPLQRVSMQ